MSCRPGGVPARGGASQRFERRPGGWALDLAALYAVRVLGHRDASGKASRALLGELPPVWLSSFARRDLPAGDKPLLAGRGRSLLATLAGAGLRIDEALSLQRRSVNLVRGTLAVTDPKTAAGVRIVDLTPALRDELALWFDRSPFKAPTDFVFPTLTGKKDNRQNIRQRLLQRAIERANEKLVGLGIEPIGRVSPHGLRCSYAALRCAVGDDVAYTAEQMGHEDPTFTLRVYTDAVKRRQRLSGAELDQFNRAIEWAQWAQMGTNGESELAASEPWPVPERRKAPR